MAELKYFSRNKGRELVAVEAADFAYYARNGWQEITKAEYDDRFMKQTGDESATERDELSNKQLPRLHPVMIPAGELDDLRQRAEAAEALLREALATWIPREGSGGMSMLVGDQWCDLTEHEAELIYKVRQQLNKPEGSE